MLSTHIVPQILFNPLVDDLGLPMYLRVIVVVGCQLCPHQYKTIPPECPNKPTIPVTDDVPRKPMKSEEISKE
jgi:hypothetical protein